MPLGSQNKWLFTEDSSKNSLTIVHKPYKTNAWPNDSMLSLSHTSRIHSAPLSFTEARVSKGPVDFQLPPRHLPIRSHGL